MNQITVEDFDNAVKQEWDADQCILAQCAKRLGIKFHKYFTDRAFPDPKIQSVRRNFDASFKYPGDENKPELQALRASLPINL